MTEYQALQGQLAIISLMAASSLVALILVRRGVVSPLVAFGAAILLATAGGFALGYFGTDEDAPPVVQVLIEYARWAPQYLLVTYVCLIQARRYRAARNNDRLRAWFLRAPYVLGGAYLVAFAGDLAFRPPLLDHSRDLPVVVFLTEAPRYAAGASYGILAAYVFFTAVRPGSGPIVGSQRLQNLLWGIALGTLGALAVYGLVWRSARAFLTEELPATLVGYLSNVQFVATVVFEASIVLGILAYYAQGKRGRFIERFLDFLYLVGDLAEELANAPVSKGKLNLPYAAMHQAAGEGFLDLSPIDGRRMDNAFLAKVVWEYRAGEGQKGRREGRISRRRLSDLAKAYEEELSAPVLAEGLLREAREERLPGTLRDLLPEKAGEEGGHGGIGVERQGLAEGLALALRTGEEDDDGVGSDPDSSAEWEQLVYVALADAGLLPNRQREAILNGRGVSEKVFDSYRLAQYKLRSYWEDPPHANLDSEAPRRSSGREDGGMRGGTAAGAHGGPEEEGGEDYRRGDDQ